MKHYIIVKWNQLVRNKDEAANRAEEVFSSVVDISGITKVEVIKNVVDRPNRYDLMIVITMTPDALPAYDASEQHVRWKADFGALIEAKTIFDAE